MYTYQLCESYKKVQKQADKFFKELKQLRKTKTTVEIMQKFYEKWHNTRLYKNYSAVYCQILADTM